MHARQSKKHSRLFLAFAYIMLAWVLPLIISIGRLLSSAGSAAFVFPKFMDFVSSWDQAPNNSTMPIHTNTTATHHVNCASSSNQECLTGWSIASAIAMMAFNIIVNLMTRTPVTFAAYRRKYNKLKMQNDDNNESTDEESKSYFDFKGMTMSSGLIYAGLKGVNATSGAFVGLGTYLSVKSLGEFVEQCILYTNLGAEHPAIRIALYETMAIFFTLSSVSNYYTFNIETGDENAKALAESITRCSRPRINCASIATAVLASPATLCVGPMAFFTTFHALEKICWITMPVQLRYTISGISYFTATTARILTDIPCMYKMINGIFDFQAQNCAPTRLSFVTVPYRAIVCTAGIGDSAGTAISNFTGFINTVKLLTPISQHHPALLAGAGLCSLSTGGLNFAFGVHNGANKAIATFFKPKTPANDGYQAGNPVAASVSPTIEDAEAGNAGVNNNTVFEFPNASQPIDVPVPNAADRENRDYLAASI